MVLRDSTRRCAISLFRKPFGDEYGDFDLRVVRPAAVRTGGSSEALRDIADPESRNLRANCAQGALRAR